MTEYEIQVLATYNAEKARGLMHTVKFMRWMKELQLDYDRSQGVKL